MLYLFTKINTTQPTYVFSEKTFNLYDRISGMARYVRNDFSGGIVLDMKRRGIVLCILLSLCTVALFSSLVIGSIIWSDSGDKILDSKDLQREYSTGFLGQTVIRLNNATMKIPDEIQDKIAAAKEINSDVIGWIRIEGLGVDYPVLYSEDNKAYLRTNIEGEYDVAGAIYLDSNYPDPYCPIKLIHGHNMKNGSMFASLPQMLFWDNLDDAPVIEYYDELGGKVFEIFSVFSVNAKEESLIVNPTTDLDELSELKSQYFERSWPESNNLPNSVEMLMLNTCWYGLSGDEHFLHCIVVASRVK